MLRIYEKYHIGCMFYQTYEDPFKLPLAALEFEKIWVKVKNFQKIDKIKRLQML